MHIVFVTYELASKTNPSGGLASFTANIARIFALKGHKVTVVLATSKEEDVELGGDICVENIYVSKSLWNFVDKISNMMPYREKHRKEEFRRYLLFLYKGIKVRKIINEINKENNIDIVHYCNHGGFPLFHNKLIPYVIRISGFLNICKAADKLEFKLGYKDNPLTIRERLEEKAVKESEYVISPSELLKEIAYKNLGKEVTVLESPFLLNQGNWDERNYNEIAKGKRYIIHYGTLGYLKGTHIVAQIAHALLRGNSDLHLILAGKSKEITDESGNPIWVHELVERGAGEYSDRVIYAGQLSREQLYPFIQNAELCLLPSRIENLSNTCIEAMAMGKIVVATNGASFEQLINDRVNGFLCERDNPESFLKAINEALSMSTEDKEQMILKAAERIKLLSPESVYERYLNYYQQVIEGWRR